MTDNNHPITPPPELVEEWIQSTRSNDCLGVYPENYEYLVATQAARWGADQELEACCKLLELSDSNARDFLYSARRPKPPSLKQQALQALANADGADHPVVTTVLTADQHALIRKALEQLDD